MLNATKNGANSHTEADLHWQLVLFHWANPFVTTTQTPPGSSSLVSLGVGGGGEKLGMKKGKKEGDWRES